MSTDPKPADIEKAAVRITHETRTAPGDTTPALDGGVRVIVLDPNQPALDSRTRDVFAKWKDRQAHGRLTYEMMLRHPAVSTAFDLILSFIKTAEPTFVPANQDPTDSQKLMADFLNWQILRLGATGQAADGWSKFVDGSVGNCLEFGFSLSEMAVRTENWRGRPMKQVTEIRNLPQASLDDGFQPREEYGETIEMDPRYHCFDFDDTGRITGIHQYRVQTSFQINPETGRMEPVNSGRKVISWQGPDMMRILHFVHRAGDGNPYGQSILFSAFYPWSDLYVRERKDQNFLDLNSEPIALISRNSKDDVPSPAFNTQVETALKKRAAMRVVTGTNISGEVLDPSMPGYVNRIEQNISRLRKDIIMSMLVPQEILSSENDDAANVRDLIQVFIRYRLPALFREIEDWMTWQFGKRLIDANFTNVDVTDYPRFRLRLHIADDLRAAGAMLQQLIPYIDSDRLGEAMEQLLPGFRKEWVPKDHSKSVAEQRKVVSGDAEFKAEQDSKNNPPDRTGQRGDGGGAGAGDTVRQAAKA